MAKLWRVFVVGVSLLTALGLLVTAYSRVLDPVDNPIAGILSLGYPILLCILMFLILVWAMAKSKWTWVLISTVLLTFPVLKDFVQLKVFPSEELAYSIISYNTQLFGYYQFERNKEIRDANVRMLDSLDADIHCFQEFYFTPSPNGFKTLTALENAMGSFEVHAKYTHEFVHKQHFGVVTISKFPIVNKGYVPFAGEINNFCIYSDISLPSGDTIRVYNAHLASIHFRPDDYALADGEKKTWREFWKQIAQVGQKLSLADAKRSAQINTVMDEVKKSPFPCILAGDFNAAPYSYAYHIARQDLQDTFCSAGSGVSATYRSKIPLLRIDHVFHDTQIRVGSYDVIDCSLSDHRPVRVTFDTVEP